MNENTKWHGANDETKTTGDLKRNEGARRIALNTLKDAGIDLPDSNLCVLKTDEESRWRIGINDESKATTDGKSANIAR
ncbi:MAG: hypothetical protein ACR2MD_02935 [Aridibacter sp.]